MKPSALHHTGTYSRVYAGLRKFWPNSTSDGSVCSGCCFCSPEAPFLCRIFCTDRLWPRGTGPLFGPLSSCWWTLAYQYTSGHTDSLPRKEDFHSPNSLMEGVYSLTGSYLEPGGSRWEARVRRLVWFCSPFWGAWFSPRCGLDPGGCTLPFSHPPRPRPHLCNCWVSSQTLPWL